MVGTCETTHAGITSTISSMAYRRMAAGPHIRAVSQNVSRPAWDHVPGCRRSTQALFASRYSEVERCQACAGMPRSSSSTW
jgi:hypothetical protein